MNVINDAASLLIQRRQQGTQGSPLPDLLRPTTSDAALTIQRKVAEMWCEQEDDLVGGWKCGLPQQGRPILAPIFMRSMDSVPPVALYSDTHSAFIEPEFAFFLSHDLPPRAEPYTQTEIISAIGRVHLAVELIRGRYEPDSGANFYDNLADGLVNQGVFIGPAVDGEPDVLPVKLPLQVAYDGNIQLFEGVHPAGDPLAPLCWLVNFLNTHQQGLVAGQAIITGSLAGVIEVPLGKDIHVVYDGLGEIHVSFTAKPMR